MNAAVNLKLDPLAVLVLLPWGLENGGAVGLVASQVDHASHGLQHEVHSMHCNVCWFDGIAGGPCKPWLAADRAFHCNVCWLGGLVSGPCKPWLAAESIVSVGSTAAMVGAGIILCTYVDAC